MTNSFLVSSCQNWDSNERGNQEDELLGAEAEIGLIVYFIPPPTPPNVYSSYSKYPFDLSLKIILAEID